MGALDAAADAAVAQGNLVPEVGVHRAEAVPAGADTGRPQVPAILAILEIVDRDGHVRQALDVRRWPVRIGRALDNDLVLADPHVAAWHGHIAPGERGLEFVVGDTRNGVRLGAMRLRAGDRAALGGAGARADAGAATATATATATAIDIGLGRTHLRLRLPEHAVAPEVPLAPTESLTRRVLPIAGAAGVLAASVTFQAFLATDPDGLTRAAGMALLTAVAAAAVWCGAWALLSKTFTRQSHFGWHLRVFLFAALALTLLGNVAALLAFALSWPEVSDFAFIAEIAIVAVAIYFHLLAVEPARRRALRWVALGGAAAGVALTMWFNVQRTDRLGDELYMNHLFPPALRLARPMPADAFVEGLAPLKAALDKAARQPARGDDLLPTEPE